MVFDAGTEKCQTFCGKNNYLRPLRPKIPLVVLQNWIHFVQTGNLLSDKHQLLLVSILWKKIYPVVQNDLIGGVPVKAAQIVLGFDFSAMAINADKALMHSHLNFFFG